MEHLDGELEMEAFRKLLSGYEKARNEGLAPINPALEMGNFARCMTWFSTW